MLRKRLISLLVAFTLMLTVVSASGIVADSLGITLTPSAFACQQGSGSGGGC